MKTRPNLTAHSLALLQGTAYSRLHVYLTEILNPFDVSIPEWKLLGQLYDNGNIRLAELSEFLSYDPPMVTKLAKKLEKKKLLNRESDPTDERAKIVVITPQGIKLIQVIDPEVKKKMQIILNGVAPDELGTYIKVLSVIVNNTRE